MTVMINLRYGKIYELYAFLDVGYPRKIQGWTFFFKNLFELLHATTDNNEKKKFLIFDN